MSKSSYAYLLKYTAADTTVAIPAIEATTTADCFMVSDDRRWICGTYWRILAPLTKVKIHDILGNIHQAPTKKDMT